MAAKTHGCTGHFEFSEGATAATSFGHRIVLNEHPIEAQKGSMTGDSVLVKPYIETGVHELELDSTIQVSI